MNGPQHYVEAEKLLRHADAGTAENAWHSIDLSSPASPLLVAALVHAALAQAAATAMASLDRMDEDDFREWDKVAGVQTGGGS